MSPKLEIAVCLLLTLVPFWIAVVLVDMTRRAFAVVAFVTVAAGGCFLLGGFKASLVMIGCACAACMGLGIAKVVVLRVRRARLVEGSRPERADLERWVQRELRKRGWSVGFKAGPLRQVASKSCCETFHIFCITDYETVGVPNVREFGRYASMTKAPVILLLFGGAPAMLVENLRDRQLLPVSYRDFLNHVALASSRTAFVNSCRTAIIEEVILHPALYPQATLSMA